MFLSEEDTAKVRYFDCACDTNNDEKFTFEEMQAEVCKEAQNFATDGYYFTKARFDLADSNKDGLIDSDELTVALKNDAVWA